MDKQMLRAQKKIWYPHSRCWRVKPTTLSLVRRPTLTAPVGSDPQITIVLTNNAYN